MAHEEFDAEIAVEEKSDSLSEDAAPVEADAPSRKEERGGPTDIFGDETAPDDGDQEAPRGFTPPEIEGVAWEGEQLEVYQLGAETAERLGIDPATYNELAAEFIAQLQGQDTGIPETPDGYVVPQTEGVEWSDADKPVLDSFMSAAHSAGLPQAAVDGLAGWYHQAIAEQQKAQRAIDQADAAAAREALQSSWGGEAFKQNLGAVKTQLDKLPDGLGSHIRSARTADGRLLVNQPGFLNLLLSRESRTPPTRADRKAKIEAVMRTDMNRYWSTPGLDQEYQQILAEEEKNK